MTTRIEIIEPLRAREIADISDIRKLADWLDTRFVIPGTNLRFGLDSVIGLVPGVGDGVTALMSLYIMHRARELGAPPLLLARMGGNVVLDTLLGAAARRRLRLRLPLKHQKRGLAASPLGRAKPRGALTA
jgi:hypothetical protein